MAYENLCHGDKRNPLWKDLYGFEDPEDIPDPRDRCYCDNCFYGRDGMAVVLLEFLDGDRCGNCNMYEVPGEWCACDTGDW